MDGRAPVPPRRHLPGRQPGRRAPRPALLNDITALTTGHVLAEDGRTLLPGQPPDRPATLDALVAALEAGRRAPGSSLLHIPSPMLFPGRRPGSAERGRARPAASRHRDQPAARPRHRAVYPGRRSPGRYLGQDARHPRHRSDPVLEDRLRGLGRLCRRRQPQPVPPRHETQGQASPPAPSARSAASSSHPVTGDTAGARPGTAPERARPGHTAPASRPASPPGTGAPPLPAHAPRAACRHLRTLHQLITELTMLATITTVTATKCVTLRRATRRNASGLAPVRRPSCYASPAMRACAPFRKASGTASGYCPQRGRAASRG